MGYISTFFLIIALLPLVYGWAGLVDPSWVKSSNMHRAPSRIDCALFASLLPLPFAFMGDLFRAADKSESLFSFLLGGIMLVGSIGFYLWGVYGVKNYLQREKNFSPAAAVMVGCILGVLPFLGFIVLGTAMLTSNIPNYTWLEQIGLFMLGMFVLVGFAAFFDIPILESFTSSSSSTVNGSDIEENELCSHAANHATTAESWLFSFTYTEDDGLPSRVDAWISTAEFDDQGRRYIQGVCAKTSTTRFFWLGRILGPMTGPAEEDSDGEERDASEVFDQLLAFQAEDAEA
ncbi:MAG: hypothetical protein ACRDD3_00620 [Azovibrio sp.]